MDSLLLHPEIATPVETTGAEQSLLVELWHWPLDRLALTLALTAVPISIVVAESLLALALVGRLVLLLRGQVQWRVPRVFWFWLGWAVLELLSWCASPEMRRGWSEVRHLFLIGGLFLALPALESKAASLSAWRGVFLGATLGSLFLIGDFFARLFQYHREIAAGDDVSFYVRTGGLLNNWMVFGTVEILVIAGLLSFWSCYPQERRRWWPALAINALAAVLTLTRTVWICCLLMLGLELVRKRSRWFWLLPLLPLVLYILLPGAIRSRVRVSMRPDYFSNAERIQMLRVGWRMIRENPITGVGPGRIERLYRNYLSANDPVPMYHGHLHNNLVQLAAEFGIPVALAALMFAGVLYRDLYGKLKRSSGRESDFLFMVALLGLTGFLVAGLFDYTYGHSLGLILLSFAVLPPLLQPSGTFVAGQRPGVRRGKVSFLRGRDRC